MKKSYASAVGAVRAAEVRLADAHFTESLLSLKDVGAVCAMLSDRGTGDFAESENPLAAAESSLTDAWDFLMQIVPSAEDLQFLIVKNDFHNLKAAIKALAADCNPEPYFMRPCITDSGLAAQAVKSKDFGLLPDWLGSTAEKAYSLITETFDGRTADAYIDSESVYTAAQMSKISDSPMLAHYGEVLCDTTNFKTAVRLCRIKADDAAMRYAFARGGTVDCDTLRHSTAKGIESVTELVSQNYPNLAAACGESSAVFERECDNTLLHTLDGAAMISFGPEPPAAYYLACEAQCKNIRIILASIMSGVGTDKAAERMRDLYV